MGGLKYRRMRSLAPEIRGTGSSMDTEISKNGVWSHSDGCESGAKIFREGGEVTVVMGKGTQVRTPRELQFD